MAAKYKMLKTVVILLSFTIRLSLSQFQSVANVAQIFCLNGDNFSCPPSLPEEGTNCLFDAEICDGELNCIGGADEGSEDGLSSLNCDPDPENNRDQSMFSCGRGVNINFAALCDGVDDCGAAGGITGSDEDNFICDNKCLLPYYGGCSYTEICDNSRGGVNCDECVSDQSYVRIPGNSFCTPLVDFTVDFDSTSAVVSEDVGSVLVCVNAQFISDLDLSPLTNDPAQLAEFEETLRSSPPFSNFEFILGSVSLSGTSAFPADANDYDVIDSSTFHSLTFDTPFSRDCFQIAIDDDTEVENTETIQVVVTMSSNDTISRFNNAATNSFVTSITILDNDVQPPLVGFQFGAYSNLEGDGAISVTIVNDNPFPQPFTVLFSAFMDNSIAIEERATAGGTQTDFMAQSQTMVQFGANSVLETVNVVLIDDFDVEQDEIFTMSLSSPSIGTINSAAATAQGIILNDDIDPVFGFLSSAFVGTEASEEVEVNIVLLNSNVATIREVITLQLEATVISTGLSFASADDFSVGTQAVIFNPGDILVMATVGISNDLLQENTEAFALSLSNPQPSGTISSQASTATGSIIDNDTPSIGFQLPSFTGSEASESVLVTLVVTNQVIPAVPVEVQVDAQVDNTEPNPANAGDFDVGSQDVTFNPGQTLVQVAIGVTNDFFDEDDEVFALVLSGSLVDPTMNLAQGVIQDNDDTPEFGFSSTTFSGSETSEAVIATIVVTNGVSLTQDFTVVLSAQAVGGADGANFADFDGTPQSVVISAGTLQSEAIVDIEDDLLVENTESFTLLLSNPSPIGTISQGSATAFITDNDVPIFGFSPLAFSFVESDNSESVSIVITNSVTLQPGVSRTIRINSENAPVASPQQAIGDLDYVSVNNEDVEIGVTPFIFQIELMEDTIVEEAEQFVLVLSQINADAMVDFSSAEATVTIEDDDIPLFGFDPLNQNAAEGSPILQFCLVLLSGELSQPFSVPLSLSSGSATTGEDFLDGNLVATFPANSVPDDTACVFISIEDDTDVEPLEFFSVSADSGLFPGGSTSSVGIEDNDLANLRFQSVTVSVVESTPQATVVVEIAPGGGVLTEPVTLSVSSTGGGSASSSDFTPNACQLTFPIGSGPGSSMSCPFSINDDDMVENAEDIMIIANMAPGQQALFLPDTNSATINILDNDVLELAFSEDEYSMLESSDQVICLVVQSGSLGQGIMVSVSLTTAPGPSDALAAAATPMEDYDPDLPSVTFSPGDQMQCVTLEIVDDELQENKERLRVIASPSGLQVVVPDSVVDALICDEDLVAVAFEMTVFSSSEGEPAIQICLNLVDGFVGPSGVTVMVESTGGTAEEGEDYTAINENVFFQPFASAISTPPVNTQSCFTFQPSEDTIVEFTETVLLTASSDNPDVLFPSGNMATIEIADNDFVTVTITQPPPSTVEENGGPAMACIQIAGVVNLQRPVMIQLMTEDGTAIGAAPGIQADYCTEDEVITIQPGEENLEFCREVLINDDNLCEGPETFNIVAEMVPEGGAIASNSPQTITILDDDVAEISANDISIPENIGMALVPVLLSGQKGPGRSCEVIATTMDGTAVSIGLNPDYMPLVGGVTLTFDSDTTFIQLELEINDDGICEGMEQFQVMLSTSSPGCMIADDSSSITVTIEDDEIGGGGDDPHFSIVLPSGKLLCYTVQGEHGFSFNLISNKKMTMNARFVPDTRRSEVTWMGSMGIIVHDNTYKQSNATALRFEALEKKIYIGDKVILHAKSLEKLTFKNGKLTISEAPPTDHFRYPSIYVDLQDVEITFTMKFMSEHLDIFWHRTGGKLPNSHGLIGQFFRKGVEIDEVRKILIMPNKEPVPVMRRPVWSFMEREKSKAEEEQLCWTAMNPGYQGEGLIDGTYFDYLVDSVMTGDFQFLKTL